ncbi:hypothetical protein B0187_05765 [Haemophilus paracuniculus]|uniref:Uncharacterized protein n=1 Tax=Haemophilus paracuniculus TaxID=734 RepID=A0A1T0ASF6_9PAST|nr:hypothetical protein [Haemophilus paracuniculus]OOR99263.1 hypothetical protein B0187_05765 [Haemophilus paracuniculus]
MWNLLSLPNTIETIEAWAKILEDIAKVAVLAIPVVLYGDKTLLVKCGNSFLLLCVVYACLIIAKLLRNNKTQFIGEK